MSSRRTTRRRATPRNRDGRGKQRLGALAVLTIIGATLAVLLQATELGEKVAKWIRGDDTRDTGRVVVVDLASAVSLADAAGSVSPVRECFDVARQPRIIVRRERAWPPVAAVSLLAQVPDDTPTATPTSTSTPSPSPTATPTITPEPTETAAPTLADMPGASVELEGDDLEVVVQPQRTPAPTPSGAPPPPPANDDAELVDGAAQNVMVFPQSYTREEIERLAPQVRVGPASGGKRQPEGQLVDVQVKTTGFLERCVYARWSLYRMLAGGGKRHVPERWAVNRAAMFLRPDDTPADGSGQFWVPLPERRRRHFVRVALFDDEGNRLGPPRESPRFR